jgi:hypothetical protein
MSKRRIVVFLHRSTMPPNAFASALSNSLGRRSTATTPTAPKVPRLSKCLRWWQSTQDQSTTSSDHRVPRYGFPGDRDEGGLRVLRRSGFAMKAVDPFQRFSIDSIFEILD